MKPLICMWKYELAQFTGEKNVAKMSKWLSKWTVFIEVKHRLYNTNVQVAYLNYVKYLNQIPKNKQTKKTIFMSFRIKVLR